MYGVIHAGCDHDRCDWDYIFQTDKVINWPTEHLEPQQNILCLKNEASISASSLCPGGLSLAVEGPSKAEITCKDNKDGTCTVSYLPTAPGDYNIIVKFDDKHIPGSPFTAKITGTAPQSSALHSAVSKVTHTAPQSSAPNSAVREVHRSRVQHCRVPLWV